MSDWKEMYLHLMRETERAVRILTEAQQTCEELYLRAGETVPQQSEESTPPELPVFSFSCEFSSKKPLTNPCPTDILDEPL